ncbi:hypothetical protein [Helicobacter bilis]|uniref:hypothetical protein n=1 Tax=Helicobacter bilis TaxID=37372 RepID=UPI0025581C7E|nr:hypothetical protein [Helicobacter bilis]
MIVTSICMLGVLLLLSNGACRLSLKDSKTSFSRKVLIVFSFLSLICFLPIIENVSIVKHIYSYFDSPSFFAMILICAACLRLVDFRVRNNKNQILDSKNCTLNPAPAQVVENIDSINCHTEALAEVSRNIESKPVILRKSEKSKNTESKKDFSPFSKARTSEALAHTCKNDNKQNLDSINFAPLHPAPAHLDKHLDSVNYTLNPIAHPNLVENIESNHYERNAESITQNRKNLESNICHVERSETSESLDSKQNNLALNIQNKTTKDSKNNTQLMPHTHNDINQDSTPHQNKHCIESSNIGFNIYTALILFIYGAILYGGSLGMIDFYLQELAIQSSHLQDFDTHAFNPLNINTFSTQAFDIYHATLLNQALISFVLLVLLYISNKEIGILALFSFILFYILSGENASLLECFICPYLWLYSIFYIVYRILLRFYRFVS